MQIAIDIDENLYTRLFDNGVEDYEIAKDDLSTIVQSIRKGTPLTSSVLADKLMEERIRGDLTYNTSFEKEVISDVKCRLTVSILDNRFCCSCGAGLREVWRDNGDK